jgi:hypothetical protein
VRWVTTNAGADIKSGLPLLSGFVTFICASSQRPSITGARKFTLWTVTPFLRMRTKWANF